MNSKKDCRLSDLFPYGFPATGKLPPGVSFPGRIVADGYVGIEIEAEGFVYRPDDGPVGVVWKEFNRHWTAKEERSLRNRGGEYVTAPVQGEMIPYVLDLMKRWEKLALARPMIFNDLTGLHVHLNAQDFTCGEVCSLYTTFALFEKELIEFSGGRQDNIYCLPLENAVSGARGLVSTFKEGNWRYFMDAVYRGSKYLGLNYRNLRALGTIEFRQASGTDDFDKIINWVNLILRLREFVKNNEFFALKTKIFELNSSSQYEQFAEEVFKDQLNLLSRSTLAKHMAQAVALVKTWDVSPDEIYVQDVKRVEKKVVRRNPAKIPERVVFPRREDLPPRQVGDIVWGGGGGGAERNPF